MDDTNLNLPFEVVAVPQHLPTTTSYTTPIKVKIKIKKGENNSTTRKGVISVPKLKPIHPEVSRRVRSDETIMSFNIRMEPENESKPRRKSQNKFFHIFKTGICFDTEDEDENDPPYMLASSDKSSETKPQRLSHDKKEKISTKTTKNKSKTPDYIFGKCKTGGCLDPPFGEDKYQYYRPIKLKQLKGTEEENLQKPYSENAANDKRENRIAEIGVKSTDNKESDASSTHMLYKVGSRNDALDDKYSDSIITYPTRTSSRDLSSLERSVISKKSSSFKTRQLNVDTYFAPTKLSKSQERKRESVNKRNTDTKDDVKEIIKIDVPSCNIPITRRTGDMLLDDKVINLETLQTNPPQLKNQSNYKVSQLVEVSGNILLTVSHILEPTTSLDSKPEEIKISEAKEVNSNCLDHTNATEILKSTAADVTGEQLPTLNKLSSSSVEIFENLQNLNRPTVKTVSTIISNEKQIFIKKDAENGQIHYAIPKYEEQENQLSHVDSNENLSKLVSQEKIVKELPIKYSSHKTNETTSEMPQYIVKEVKPQTHDLNLMTETMPNIEKKLGPNYFIDTTLSNEQLPKHITHVLDNSHIEKVKNGNIQINEDLNLDSNKKSDKLKMSINSVYNNDRISEKMLSNHYIPAKLKHSNSIPNNDIVHIDNDIQTTKEAKTKPIFFTTNDKEKVIKDIPISNVLLNNAGNTSPDFAVATNNLTLSFDDTRQGSNENLLRHNDLVTTENASKISNNVQLNQFQEKERSLSNGNILDNLPPENKSILIQDTLPATFATRKYMTTIPNTEIDGSNNTTDNNIKTIDTNEILDSDITSKQDSTKTGIKTETDNSLSSIDIGPQHRQYALFDISSTPVIAGDIKSDNIVSENVSEPAKDKNRLYDLEHQSSYHGNNEDEIDKNIPTQKRLSKDRLYDLEYQRSYRGNNEDEIEKNIPTQKRLSKDRLYDLEYQRSYRGNNEDEIEKNIPTQKRLSKDRLYDLEHQRSYRGNNEDEIDKNIPTQKRLSKDRLYDLEHQRSYHGNNEDEINKNIPTQKRLSKDRLYDLESQRSYRGNNEDEIDKNIPTERTFSKNRLYDLEHQRSYHGNNEDEINKNIPTQKRLSKNRLYDLEHQPTNITNHDISNKSSLIESTKYLEINNDIGIPYNIASKENSIKPPLSTVISANSITSNDAYLSSTTNATRKERLGEIRQTPDIQYYSKAIDSKYDKKYDEKHEEWVPSNGVKKIKSKSAFKPAENNTTIVELGFHTYIDENGDTLLKTFDVHQEPQRFTQDSIFVTRKVLGLNDSHLSFSINSNTRLLLKIDNSTNDSKERSFKEEVSPTGTTQRIYRNNKMRYQTNDIGTLQESLSAVYENDLIPVEQLIRSLRLQIDRIIQYNHLLRKKSVTTIKKLKPTYSKRCVCIRKWYNID